MKTVTSKWAGYQDQVDAPRSLVLKLTDGSSTWYFSNRLLKITDGYCHPYLSSNFSTKEGFDFQTKRWVTPTVSLRLTNALMEKQDTGSYLRVSDKIANVPMNIATLYGALGGDVSALSQMMVIFEGQIVDPIEATESTVTVIVSDRTRLWNITLPNRIVQSEYASAPTESLARAIPIAYGSFTTGTEPDSHADYTGNGLATGVLIRVAPPIKGIPDTAGEGTLYCLADHVVDAITELWLTPLAGEHPVQCVDTPPLFEGVFPILDVDDSGLATGEAGSYIEMYLECDGIDSTGYSIDTHAAPTNPANAFDQDNATYGESASEQNSYFPLTVAAGDDLRGVWPIGAYWYLDGIVNRGSVAADNYYVSVYYDYDAGDVNTTEESFTPGSSWQNMQITGPAGYDLQNTVANLPLMIVLSAHHGTGGTDRYLRVYEARLRCYAVWDRRDEDIVCYAAMDGKVFGSWIDDTGHSTNFDEGDLIDDPVQIVQDILRTWLSLGDTNIDYVSFAAAENTSVSARLNLHEDNKMKVYDIVRQLAEQSTAAMYVTCQGKWRAVALNNESPTTARTIIWTDAASVSVTSVGEVVNQLTVKSRWQAEYGDYRDVDIVSDATSQSDYGGVYAYEASWPNICGTSMDHVAAWLVNTTDGIWSKDHNVVNLSLRGWKHFDLECGDVIELDATSCDPHLLLKGATWADHQFTIVEIGYRQGSIDIKAVELY